MRIASILSQWGIYFNNLQLREVFLNMGAMEFYFVLRSQDSSQISVTSLFTCSMFDFHDANDRQYFE
jgi:hypothetical protein